MIERRAGRILNLASTSSFQAIPYLSTYAASKAYVLSLSEALSIELKDKCISVTALCPGFTETEMIAKHDGQSMTIPLVRNLSAVEVANQGYAVCMSGAPVYITGLANQMLIGISRYQPRWLQRLTAELVAKRSIHQAPV
jgi:short-subunit dehydrogenase